MNLIGMVGLAGMASMPLMGVLAEATGETSVQVIGAAGIILVVLRFAADQRKREDHRYELLSKAITHLAHTLDRREARIIAKLEELVNTKGESDE